MEHEPLKLPQWYENISDIFRDVPRESVRHYNIETIPRLMCTLDHKKDQCEECRESYIILYKMLEHAAIWVKDETPELKQFQKQLQNSAVHLKKKHNMTPKGLLLSRYTLYGIVSGIITALLFNLGGSQIEIHELLMLFIAGGMTLGWVTGKSYERILKKQGKIF
ncbi:hypothetical protein [Alkalitalea saponilacus]|uniref:Uncharacterized protein n=1 Tax=Alkalitalea saponilacus TaxID=889453 RepID=A0A1T5EQ97_9BACT|nr:hypothetical protein [Alkalitalea saponilacus]ASB48058.1 hypothetical protein CDL62_02310 [Alkalitalea saponilacus]SKB86117.1 hypothetical protein SAMN03080601_01360 [Alkalitalea saponilacus]